MMLDARCRYIVALLYILQVLASIADWEPLPSPTAFRYRRRDSIWKHYYTGEENSSLLTCLHKCYKIGSICGGFALIEGRYSVYSYSEVGKFCSIYTVDIWDKL